MNILARKEKDFLFLILIIFSFFILRLPSLFEPYWYGDEGIYQTIGIAINQGRLLYSDIWDNKPPLLYLLYAFFNSDQFFVRFVSLLFGIASVITFFEVAKKLFGEKMHHIVLVTTSLFSLLFAIPLLEGNIANAENFMLFPTLLAAFFLLSFARTKKPLFLAGSGFLLSVSFLFKTVAAFDMVAFSLFAFFVTFTEWKRLLPQIKSILFLPIAFSIPILLTALFFIFKGAFVYFYQASFTQMIGYVGYGNRFIIPQGLLIAKLLLLAFSCFFIFTERKKLNKETLFIIIWFAFSLFNAFFAGRPYTHYMLVLLPSFILFFGLLLSNTQPVSIKKSMMVIFIVVLFIIINYFNFFKKTVFYYQNFISFMTHAKSVSDYRAFFDSNTPKDYETAQFINMHVHANESIFVWGNNAQLYKLTNKLPSTRFTVAYHMTASKETLKETERSFYKASPKFIIIVLHDSPFPYGLTAYANRIIINEHVIYERIY